MLPLSEIRKENVKLRLDSAYFGKEAMRLDSLVRSFRDGFVELGDTVKTFRKGIFDIKSDSYTETGIPFVRISNLRDGIINEAGIAYISEEAHAAELKTAVRRGDLAISKTAYPAASYVQLKEANVSQDVIAYRMSHEWKNRLRAGFLAAYLNSTAGIALMQRQFQGNVQLHLSLDDGRKIPIPLICGRIQETVEASFVEAFDEINRSAKNLAEAEQSLMEEIGLAKWTPAEPLTYHRRSKDVFAAGRLDSAFFAPRVQQLIREANCSRADDWQRGSATKAILQTRPRKAVSVHRNQRCCSRR